jgi:hypothetical protein
MMFPTVKQVNGDVSDVNAEFVTNIHFRCKLLFSDFVDVVAAMYKC